VFENAAHGERERSIIAQLVGKRVGYRELVIALTQPHTAAVEVREFLRANACLPRGVRIEREYVSLWDHPDVAVERINRFRPDVIHSYGSYFEMLFSYLAESGAPFHRPKVVWYSSDEMSGPVRRLIEDRFAIPVIGTYQAVEAFKIGFECRRHPGLHVNADLYPVRVVDADGVARPMGERGDIVISNLVNRATVLLNYRLDDVAALLPERCPCGRSLPLLSPLAGRRDEWFKLASGRLVHTQLIRVFTTTEPSIRRYQVIQLSDREIGLAVIANGTDDLSALRRRLLAGLGEILGEGVTVDVRFVGSIPRTAGGKHRPIVPLEHADQIRWPPADDDGELARTSPPAPVPR
jgi:phenylacetate-CoA ligase